MSAAEENPDPVRAAYLAGDHDEMNRLETDAGPAAAPKQTQSMALVRLALAGWDLGVTPADEGYAVRKPLGADLPPRVSSLRGGRYSLRGELAYLHHAATGSVPTSSALTDAMAVLEATARGQEPRDLHLRVASHDGVLVLDLGDEEWTAAVVGPDGWQVRRPPVLFRRTALTGRLPTPERGGSLDELRALLNVADSSWPVLLAWLVATLIPEIPHPVVLLTGESGTGKTTCARAVAATVDSSGAQVRTAPRDIEGWAVATSGSWVAAIDNVSTIPDWFSDALCRTVTGDGMVRRRLYSDSDLSILAYRRCLLITSIDSGALRGDLADRLVTVELERIPPARRRREEEMAAAFAAAHPRILGALLDLAAQVLTALPDVRLDELPRMADFARVLAAVDRVLGTDGLATYLGQGARLAEEVVESDPVATAIRQLVDPRQAEWSGTAADLLAALERHRPDPRPKGWPATPRGVSGSLRRAAPSLRVVGIGVEDRREPGGQRRRVLTITRTDGVGEQPSRPSLPSRQAVDRQKRGADPGTVGGTVGTVGPDTESRPSHPAQAADQQKQAVRDGRDGRDGPAPTPSVREQKLAKLAARRATDPTLLDGESP